MNCHDRRCSTRREFDRRPSVAAAGCGCRSAGAQANSAITVGVLGTGNRGTFVSTMMAKNTPARIVALCDLFDEKMEQAKKSIGVENPKLYKDFRQMLASDIDVNHHRDAGLSPRGTLRSSRQGRQAYLHREAGFDGCGRLQARDAGGRWRRSQAEHHLRLSAPLRAGLSEGQATGGFRRDRAHPAGLCPIHQERKRVERARNGFLRPRRRRRRLSAGKSGRICRAI